jgi:CMP-N-acetylneuraminic acid synthetase
MTVVALMLGRGGSTGFPGKNLLPVLGRPLMAYPLIAARDSKHVDRVYVSTDSEEIMDVARSYGAEIIVRPPELATPEALSEHAYQHGAKVIRERLAEEGQEVELLALLYANAPNVTADLIDEGVEKLRADETLDSAITVSRYNMWSPLRARRLDEQGLLEPFVPFEVFGDPATLSCDRDSQGDVWFADAGVTVMRPKWLEQEWLEQGLLPFKWMGRRIAPIESWGGGDVDYDWQVVVSEFWLRAHGVEAATEALTSAETRSDALEAPRR